MFSFYSNQFKFYRNLNVPTESSPFTKINSISSSPKKMLTKRKKSQNILAKENKDNTKKLLSQKTMTI